MADEDHWIINIAFFSKGMLSFSTHVHRPKETIQLLERFAEVFDSYLHTFPRSAKSRESNRQRRSHK
jgi:hypothetical protein